MIKLGENMVEASCKY